MLPKRIEVGGLYGKFKTEIVDENGQLFTSQFRQRVYVSSATGLVAYPFSSTLTGSSSARVR